MVNVRKSEDRGHFDFGWLDTRHTFSFGDYHDPEHMGFRSLRVINDDWIKEGAGFGEHPHRDMEIISYVTHGALAHKDSLGHTQEIRPGDVQVMTAGRGILHAEFNPSTSERAHLIQIWIRPRERGLQPGYNQKSFPVDGADGRIGRLQQLVSPDGADNSLVINQDARLFASVLPAGSRVERTLAPGRHAWVQVVRGRVRVNGTDLGAGDGAAISDERSVAINAADESEVLLFDLD